MLRPQLKDMNGSGMDARVTQVNGKKLVKEPPVGASPGELRLWRKLNGCLTEEEKRADALEHQKAKSRANLAGRPRRMSLPPQPNKRPSVTDLPIAMKKQASAGTNSAPSTGRSSLGGKAAPARLSKHIPSPAAKVAGAKPHVKRGAAEADTSAPTTARSSEPEEDEEELVAVEEMEWGATTVPEDDSVTPFSKDALAALPLEVKKRLHAWLGDMIEVESMRELVR